VCFGWNIKEIIEATAEISVTVVQRVSLFFGGR
jgi:hypothetical protein